MLLGRGYHRLLYPNFWAEDGRNWYAEAHNAGAISLLFRPYAGYIHVLPRLVASAIAWQAPKAAAISIYVVWMLIQLWLASIIWRRRGVIGVWPAFLIITLTGLAPNSLEIYGNLSNLQWYGAIVLIVLCAVAANGRLRWDEYAAAVLLGLSGPLVLMVAIALATGFVLDRRRRDSGFVAIMTLCSMIVGFSLARVGRGATTTDSTILSYPLVLGYHVAIGGIFGMDAMRRIADRLPFAMLWVLGMLGIAVLIHGLVAATAGVKGFRDSEIPRFRDSEIPRFRESIRYGSRCVALH